MRFCPPVKRQALLGLNLDTIDMDADTFRVQILFSVFKGANRPQIASVVMLIYSCELGWWLVCTTQHDRSLNFGDVLLLQQKDQKMSFSLMSATFPCHVCPSRRL